VARSWPGTREHTGHTAFSTTQVWALCACSGPRRSPGFLVMRRSGIRTSIMRLRLLSVATTGRLVSTRCSSAELPHSGDVAIGWACLLSALGDYMEQAVRQLPAGRAVERPAPRTGATQRGPRPPGSIVRGTRTGSPGRHLPEARWARLGDSREEVETRAGHAKGLRLVRQPHPR